MMDSFSNFKNKFRYERIFFVNSYLMVSERQRDTQRFTSLETGIDVVAHRFLGRLPRGSYWDALTEFLAFGLKQAWACLFGGIFLSIVLGSAFFWPKAASFARYDFLALAAITIQIAMLVFKLEKPSEAIVILVFHIVGTGMELFKTSHGSWAYPEASYLRIGAVPLFSGFMYAAVGSYLARVTRIFDFHFKHYPKVFFTVMLSAAIYLNFFSHHFIIDLRLALFGFTAILFWHTKVYYRAFRQWHQMPLLLGFALVALFIWFAENLGSWSKVWLYPNQIHGWALVSLEKFGSWYLLMIISFVLVNLIHQPKPMFQTAPSPPSVL
jgi:uncharacterized membrane protein YoaT (DUF817 family)